MVYMSGGKSARNQAAVINRTEQSGGSIGGDKKPGIVNYGPSWKMGNQGNYLSRAPRTVNPSIFFNMTVTTRRPYQRRRSAPIGGRGMM